MKVFQYCLSNLFTLLCIVSLLFINYNSFIFYIYGVIRYYTFCFLSSLLREMCLLNFGLKWCHILAHSTNSNYSLFYSKSLIFRRNCLHSGDTHIDRQSKNNNTILTSVSFFVLIVYIWYLLVMSKFSLMHINLHCIKPYGDAYD